MSAKKSHVVSEHDRVRAFLEQFVKLESIVHRKHGIKAHRLFLAAFGSRSCIGTGQYCVKSRLSNSFRENIAIFISALLCCLPNARVVAVIHFFEVDHFLWRVDTNFEHGVKMEQQSDTFREIPKDVWIRAYDYKGSVRTLTVLSDERLTMENVSGPGRPDFIYYSNNEVRILIQGVPAIIFNNRVRQ